MQGKLLASLLILAYLLEPAKVTAKEIRKDLNLSGVFSVNWRLIGPQKQGFENQVQHEVFLADMYFGLDGKINQEYPFILQLQIPTALRGQLSLYRLSAAVINKEKVKLEVGKVLVPFGHYNELYQPNQFLTVTRPLLYASPDSLDLQIRLNSPRPPLSAGYTDVGARLSYYPKSDLIWLPSELTAYIVNGLGENNNRLRTFQNSDQLLVQGLPITGSNIDFGHENNNLADNNDDKAPGGRIVWAFGDLKIPFPVAEGIELNGVRLGFSGTFGQYNLEEAIFPQNYRIFGTDLEFQYKDFSFNGEYIQSENDFRLAQANSFGEVDFNQRTEFLPSKREINRGYYLQLAFPVWRRPPMGKKISGILAYNKMERIGPELVWSSNHNPIDGQPIAAFSLFSSTIKTSMQKYTLGLNWRLNDNLIVKPEYSYWTLNIPSASLFGSNSSYITQPALSVVFSF